MVPISARADRFRYEGFEVEPGLGRLTLEYSVDGRPFTEHVTIEVDGDWDDPAARAAARLVHLTAGVSYYKTAAPPVVDLGTTAVTDEERELLRSFYSKGLGEFAYRNGLDLSGLRFEGGLDAGPSVGGEHRKDAALGDARAERRHADGARVGGAQDRDRSRLADGLSRTGWPGTGPVVAGSTGGPGGRPLVPFGGGIDSIVTADSVRARFPDTALFVVSRPHDRFAAIERPAAVTGMPVVRARRQVDPQVLRSAELGFLNGHVPVTGIVSALAVLAAVLDRRDVVVMSNEWSASVGTLTPEGWSVNHQYSKSLHFERAFRRAVAAAVGDEPRYFSLLRPFSELWVARRFAGLTPYHRVFRSCNRSFHLDPAQRLDEWCGRCDKCCFIDLILAPFLPESDLAAVFGGREPLADPSLADRFRSLVDAGAGKPFECVGDVGECRTALLMAADRPDRFANPLLAALAAEVRSSGGAPRPRDLLGPLGRHFVPDAYAFEDQLA